MRFIWLTALVVAFPCSTAEAQAVHLPQGARVRVTGDGHVQRSAIVSGATADSLVLRLGGRTESIAWADVTTLDRSVGYRDYGRRGAMVGGGIGAIAGVIGGATQKPCGGRTPCNVEPAKVEPLAIVVLGSAGAIVGWLIGQRFETEEWESVPIRGRPRVALMGNGRVAVSVGRRF